MTDFTKEIFETVYKDDYRQEDNYHRILFNSGKALQARELTQLQTIIQEEIGRFGRNIFKEGAAVNVGTPLVDHPEFVKLDITTYGLPVSDLKDVVFTVNTLSDDPISFKVTEQLSDPDTLYIVYTDTTSATSGAEPIRVPNGATFVGTHPVEGQITLQAAALDATGQGTKLHIAEGDFFVQGHFVHVPEQSHYVSRYDSTVTADYGFAMVQDIVTESEDEALYDNQGAAPNIASPGAHRYRIKLTLSTRTETEDAGLNFVYCGRIIDGVINDVVSAVDDYNVINDLLAVRTKEESGDYIAKDFTALFDDLDEDNLELEVSEGTAYVDGYRLDFPTTPITVPKPRTIPDTPANNENFPANWGNYVVIDEDASFGINGIASFLSVSIRGYGGNATIGSCKIRGIEKVGDEYRLYIFDIDIDSPANFRDASEFYVPGGTNQCYMVIKKDAQFDPAILYGSAENNLLFPLPNIRPETISDIQYTAQTVVRRTTDVNGTLTLDGTVDSSYPWIVANVYESPLDPDESVGGLVHPDDYSISGNQITGLLGETQYEIAYYQRLTNPNRRTKTLVENFALSVAVDSTTTEVSLTKNDVVELVSVTDQNGVDVSGIFVLDGGQRDNFYAVGKLKVRGGLTLDDNTTLSIKVNYYQHTSGDYFDVNSYDSTPYSEIPSHTLASGETVNLRNVIDFRPLLDESGFVAPASINLLPKPASLISADVTYYLGRTDVLVANSYDAKGRRGGGRLQLVQGEPSLTPKQPVIPTGSLPLFVFDLNPYVLDKNDLTSTKIAHKRYTMKDIAKIDDRVNDLFELTTLSLLETNTASLNVIDSNGLARTKTGFIADGFTSFNFTDLFNEEYRASIDTEAGELRPSFREHSVRMRYDNNNPANGGARKGDLVTLPYSHENLVSQTLATSTMNINPFAVIRQQGHVTLSPASDRWVEQRSLPDIVQTAVRRVTRDLRDGRGRRTVTTTNIRTIQELIGQRVMDVEIIPFMRSQRIYFHVKGLRPNTEMFAFFGGKDVSSWVREETSFVHHSNATSDYGSQYSSATEHPFGGPSSLVTDSKGEIIGSFFLPNTATENFRTGTQQFKLLDISVNNDDGATARSTSNYRSTGRLETIQRTVRNVRTIETIIDDVDPLAQSFRVDAAENPNGLVLSKVRVYFESKDSVIPVQVQIRPVENGVPAGAIIPGSTKFVNPSDVTVTPYQEGVTDISTIRNNGTDIEFDEPVYLTAGEEYAVVLLAESTEYNVYVAQTYEFVIGPNNTQGRVAKQPTLGSLFLSQNGSTWTPDQTKDLMFELYRAEFQGHSTVYLTNNEVPARTLGANPFTTTLNSDVVSVSHQGHGFVHGDTVVISGADAVGGVDVNGQFTIDNVSFEGYTIAVPSAATSTVRGGGSNVVATEQAMFDEFVPEIDSLVPNATTVTAQIAKTSGASYGAGRTDAINGAYSLGAYEQVFLNELNTNGAPAVAYDEGSLLLKLELSTGDTRVSPMIDLQRSSVLAIENVIGTGEEAQHITTPIILDSSATGLKVLFGANRPSGSTLELYMKTATEDTGLETAAWVQVSPDADVPSDDNQLTFREYEFTALGDDPNVGIDPFTAFQIKIVMKSTNSSKSPIITDLRAIALV